MFEILRVDDEIARKRRDTRKLSIEPRNRRFVGERCSVNSEHVEAVRTEHFAQRTKRENFEMTDRLFSLAERRRDSPKLTCRLVSVKTG